MIGIFSLILLCFGLSFFILFLYSLTKQRNSLAIPFAFMCLTVSIYITGYAFELQAKSLEQIIFCLKLEYFGAPFMSGFWMLFTHKFVYKKSAPADMILFIMVFPILTLFFSATNEYHHLVYTSISTIEYQGYLLSDLTKGPWYYVNVLYAYSVQLFGMIVFFRAWRSEGYHIKTQSFWMLFGSIWPGLINLVYVTGHSPLGLDLTPFSLGISATFFFIAIFRFSFLELQEIVKDVAFLEINEGILVIDNKNRLIDFNQACRNILGWADPSQIGNDISLFDEGKKILNQKNQVFEIRKRINTEEMIYEFRKTPLLDRKTHLGSVYFIQDVTNQKKMIQELHHIAIYDALTEVFNRRKLMEETENALVEGKRNGDCLSVLMIDIDHFKLVNDQYGHQAGDDVLKSLAIICKERIRKTDIIGRYGGEEFLIILTESNEKDAFSIAESIRESIAAAEFHSKKNKIRVTVSIGIMTVCHDQGSLTVKDMIKDADQALYQAKNNGRNQSCIYQPDDFIH